ncbi:MAG: choice-of-anchor I family protein [Parvicellaceae bacterium]
MNLKNFLTLLLFIITNLSYSQYSSTLLGRYTDGRDGACEISAYDSSTVQLFITNSESDSIDIVSIQNPQVPVLVGGVDVTLYGGGVNSLVNIGNGYIAAAIEDTNAQAPGKVVFFDMNGLYINEVTVGVLPDMITVTEDKNKVIVANEGEPNDDYDVDPLGSVSVIDISGGIAGVTQADVTTIDFTSYNGQESALRAQGALIFGKKQEKTFNSALLGRYTDGRDGACEISAYDSSTAQLFITNSESDSIDIVSIQNPQLPLLVGGVDVTLYGGGVNSLVNIGNGYIAAAIEDTNAQAPGKVVFFDMSGLYINEVTVGVLPDMITVTEDKSKVIIANEGEPNDDYDIDPLGSVSVINISAGIAGVTQADVTTIDFTSYNGQESALRSQGALIFGKQPVSTPTDIFFSEYSEGSSNNKYLEIYNGTPNTIYLDSFAFPNVSNAPSNPGQYEYWNSFNSGDSIGSGDVYVIAHPSANANILAEADMTFSYLSNGDDGFGLVKGDQNNFIILDFIGNWDADPGSGWDVAGVTNGTQNHTLVRKNWVNKGNDNWSLSAGTNVSDSEWIVYPQDSIVSLGSHTLVNTKHSSVAEDLEPEYVTTDENSATAYVVCQENNAIAIIDLTTLTLDTIVGLGFKDFNLPGNGFDASNQDNGINIQNWPVKGAYQPDAIDYYSVNNTSYLVTANEGDARDYDGYSAEVRMDDLTFDPTAFPNAATLQTNNNLGRLKTFTSDVIGDTDGDGDVDELYAYGARSFSIWDENGNLVWDSGDDFEQYIAANHPTFFNCNDGLASEMDDRSDDKGPEPEAVTVGQIGNSYYAFIGLERQGGVMVYDVTDPTNPSFVNFIQTYDTTSGTMTDIAPEGLVFVPADESHNGENLLIVSSEVSGTVAIYELQDCISSTAVTDSSCNSYLWNNIVYSNSGVYSDTLSNSFGCDSIITLDLTIFNISAAIDTISGNLVASGGVNYLWNTGETASSITPDTNGLYTVIVTDINGCTDTVSFNVTFISNTGIVGLNNNFRLYPNPNNGQFVIECQEKIESIILYNIQGQIVRSFTRINSKQFTINESFNEKGIFFVNISTQNKSFIEKVVINK